MDISYLLFFLLLSIFRSNETLCRTSSENSLSGAANILRKVLELSGHGRCHEFRAERPPAPLAELLVLNDNNNNL